MPQRRQQSGSRRRLYVGLLLLAWLPPAVAENRAGDPLPPFRVYNVNDGLSQTNIAGMAMSPDGYLWLVNKRGLNRFDGHRFEVWTARDGLRLNNQTAVAVAADGSVWAGDVEGGLSQLAPNGHVNTYEPPAGVTLEVDHIVVVGGLVYVNLERNGLWRLNPATGEYLQIQPEPSYISEMVGDARRIVIRSDRSVYVYDSASGGPPQRVEGAFEGIALSASGEFWLGDNNGGMWRWSPSGIERLPGTAATNDIDRMAVDTGGRVWVRSNEELIAPSGARLSLAASIPREILVDRDGVLWASSRNGLLRYLGDRFEHYPLRNDRTPFDVRAIARDQQGRIWFGGAGQIRVVGPNGELKVVSDSLGVSSGRVTAMLPAGGNRMLIGFSENGIRRLQTDLSGSAELLPGTRNLPVTALRLTEDRWLWIATMDRGVMLLDLATGKLRATGFEAGTHAELLEPLPDGSVLATVRGDGLYHVSRSGRIRLDISDEIDVKRFLDIDVSDLENFVVSTYQGGLYEVIDGEIFRRSVSESFEDMNPYIAQRISDEAVVVGTEKGLFQVDTVAGRWYRYSQLDGLGSLEFNSDALLEGEDGSLWLGTVDGATRMLPVQGLPAVETPVPTVFPPQRRRDGKTLSPDEGLMAGRDSVVFNFVAVSTARPEEIEYSYRLRGLDTGWQEPTTAPSVNYSSLPSGDFTFEVRARLSGGQWGESASLEINVLPQLWQRPWFIALLTLFVILLSVAFHQLRLRRVRAANSRLKELVDDRTTHLAEANESLKYEVEERKRSQAAVLAMEAQARSAFEHAPIGMAMIGKDGQIVESNGAFQRLLGFDDKPGPLPMASFIWEDDIERFEAFFDRMLANETDIDSEEFGCRRSDDERLHAVFAASVVTNVEGDFSHALLQVQDVTEARVLTDRLAHQANFDELTGLHNRRAFGNGLRAILRDVKDQSGYLMFMDLDQFKVVNDTCGHGAGDELLRRVAAAIGEQVRSGDILGRLGGDEFGLILPSCKKASAVEVAERIRQTIEELVFHWNGSAFRIGISIGAVPMQTGNDAAELQQIADAACYAAKEAGRNQVHVVEGENDVTEERRGEMRWVQRLTRAMEESDFVLYGQHIVPLTAEATEIERIETLVRMREANTRRLIPPGAFLPAAERYNLGIKLDEWVVRHLLDALVVHTSVGAVPRRYWVNLSGTSVGAAGFAERILALMERASLPPGMVNFEVTETAVIQNLDQAGRFMQALRELGCEFALDDFGSGLSSFGYLKRLPVDYVKIDGVFVKNIVEDRTDRMFVKAIIDIAHSLGIRAIAECVESVQTFEVVRELGADFAQGFHLHEPELLQPSLPGGRMSAPRWTPNALDEAS